jgi:hypothetical protein
MVSTLTNETIVGKTPFIAVVRIKKTSKRREYKSIYICQNENMVALTPHI